MTERLGRDVSEDALAAVKTVVSELVNNAFLHGKGRITLRTCLGDGVVRVEVVDEGTGRAPAVREQPQDRLAIGGRGLVIVDALSAHWGVFEGTTHVWADVVIA